MSYSLPDSQKRYSLAHLRLGVSKSNHNKTPIRIILYIIFLFLVSSATFADVQPLFYETYNFAESDSLAVRQQPGHRSKKLGELALGSRLGVLECTHIKQSKWCKVEDIYFPAGRGWVNAKYIQPIPSQKGYVTIEGKKNNCYYVLKCHDKKHTDQCLIVTNWDVNENESVTLKTEWFKRSQLHPASKFSAMYEEPEADGYCNGDQFIDAYRSEKTKD